MSGSRTWMGELELLYFIVDGKAVACEYRNEARKLIQNGFFRKIWVWQCYSCESCF